MLTSKSLLNIHTKESLFIFDEIFRFDLEDAFNRYGRVKAVWVARRPPGFGFVEMEDPR